MRSWSGSNVIKQHHPSDLVLLIGQQLQRGESKAFTWRSFQDVSLYFPLMSTTCFLTLKLPILEPYLNVLCCVVMLSKVNEIILLYSFLCVKHQVFKWSCVDNLIWIDVQERPLLGDSSFNLCGRDLGVILVTREIQVCQEVENNNWKWQKASIQNH